MIHTDVGCCCSLSDVVSSVVFFCCFLLFVKQVSKQIVCYFFFFFFCFFFLFFFFLFFFFFLSLYPPFSFFSLSLPLLCWLPTTFFFFFFSPSFLLSLSCFLCPLVLSVIVWLNKRVYKIKLLIKKKKAVNDDSIATHMHCHVLSVLLTGPKKKKKKKKNIDKNKKCFLCKIKWHWTLE